VLIVAASAADKRAIAAAAITGDVLLSKLGEARAHE
jgi:hypothetical protein